MYYSIFLINIYYRTPFFFAKKHAPGLDIFKLYSGTHKTVDDK